MREILFRGKRVDNGEWVEGFYSQFHNRPILDKPNSHQIFELIDKGVKIFGTSIGGFWHIIDPETIGQFTGLTDKNGTKIFEGDIVEFDYIGNNLGVKGIEPVIFENGQFGVKWGWHKEFVSLVGFANTTITVIGNIHDNPKPLKEGG